MANSDAPVARELVAFDPSNAVLIPCEPSKFGEFISGLLGKSQSIARRIKGPYEITRDDVANIHSLIIQRVLFQNNATLASFSVITSYNDGSSVRLNSIEDFKNYSEIKPLISSDITIEWSFLIEFPGRPKPEKQTVSVSFITYREFEDDDDSYIPFFLNYSDFMVIRIEHTDRTWGADIESLVSNHLRGFLRPDKKWRQTAQKWSSLIGFLIGSFAMVGVLYAIASGADRTARRISALSADKSMNDSEMISKILAISEQGIWERFTLYSIGFVILGFIISGAIGILSSVHLSKGKRSYVLLTRKSEENKGNEENARQRGLMYFSLCAISTIALGIASNYAFKLLLSLH